MYYQLVARRYSKEHPSKRHFVYTIVLEEHEEITTAGLNKLDTLWKNWLHKKEWNTGWIHSCDTLKECYFIGDQANGLKKGPFEIINSRHRHPIDDIIGAVRNENGIQCRMCKGTGRFVLFQFAETCTECQ